MGARWTGVLTMFRRALSEALLGSEEKLMIGGIPIRAVDLERRSEQNFTKPASHMQTEAMKNRTPAGGGSFAPSNALKSSI